MPLTRRRPRKILKKINIEQKNESDWGAGDGREGPGRSERRVDRVWSWKHRLSAVSHVLIYAVDARGSQNDAAAAAGPRSLRYRRTSRSSTPSCSVQPDRRLAGFEVPHRDPETRSALHSSPNIQNGFTRETSLGR